MLTGKWETDEEPSANPPHSSLSGSGLESSHVPAIFAAVITRSYESNTWHAGQRIDYPLSWPPEIDCPFSRLPVNNIDREVRGCLMVYQLTPALVSPNQ